MTTFDTAEHKYEAVHFSSDADSPPASGTKRGSTLSIHLLGIYFSVTALLPSRLSSPIS